MKGIEQKIICSSLISKKYCKGNLKDQGNVFQTSYKQDQKYSEDYQ